MPTLVEIGNVQIRLYAKDHLPPHFHISTPDGEAIVLLADLSVLKGRIRRKDLELGRQWAAEHRELLEDEWNRLNG